MSENALENLADAVVVRPGDTLILRLPAATTPEQLTQFWGNAAALFEEKLPGVEQLAVFRPDQRVANT